MTRLFYKITFFFTIMFIAFLLALYYLCTVLNSKKSKMTFGAKDNDTQDHFGAISEYSDYTLEKMR